MVEQILEFAGIQSGQRRLEPRAVDVSALLDSVLAASAALVEAARLTVEVEIPPDLTPVSGDEPALRRVFQNLVGNAIKYGANGRWIGLRARLAASEVQITVADGLQCLQVDQVFPTARGALEANQVVQSDHAHCLSLANFVDNTAGQ